MLILYSHFWKNMLTVVEDMSKKCCQNVYSLLLILNLHGYWVFKIHVQNGCTITL